MPIVEFSAWRNLYNQIHPVIYELSDANFVWKGRNTHAFNRCYWVLAGEGIVINHTAGEKSILRPGTALFLPAGCDLEFDFREGLHFLSVHFNLEILPGIDLFRNDTHCRETSFDIFEALRVLQTLKNPPENGDIRDFDLFFRKTLHEIPLTNENPVRFAALEEHYGNLLRRVRNHPSARTGVADLADLVRLSKGTLSRRFSADFGMTLKAFLQKELAAAATRYLLGTNLSVADIAQKLEFSSEFYFSNFFRRMTGVSPRLCREQKKIQNQ